MDHDGIAGTAPGAGTSIASERSQWRTRRIASADCSGCGVGESESSIRSRPVSSSRWGSCRRRCSSVADA